MIIFIVIISLYVEDIDYGYTTLGKEKKKKGKKNLGVYNNQ